MALNFGVLPTENQLCAIQRQLAIVNSWEYFLIYWSKFHYNSGSDTVYSTWEVSLGVRKYNDFASLDDRAEYVLVNDELKLTIGHVYNGSLGMTVDLSFINYNGRGNRQIRYDLTGDGFLFNGEGARIIASGTSNEVAMSSFLGLNPYSRNVESWIKATVSSGRVYVDGSSYTVNDFTFYPSLIDLPATITCPTSYAGEMTVLTVNSRIADFQYTIQYEFGSLEGTIIEKTSETQIFWEVPTAFINEMGDAASIKTCDLKCYTYGRKRVYSNLTDTWSFTDELVGDEATTSVNILKDVNLDGPVFNPTVVDVNDTTVALTGDNTKFIKYFSNASVSSGATGRQGAIITSEQIVNGSTTINAGTGIFSHIESPVFTATDSRGTTTKTQYNVNLIDYSKLSCNVFATTPTVSGNATITIEGNFFNKSFGATTNTLTLQYYLSGPGVSLSDTVEAEISDSGYKAEFTVNGLDYKAIYYISAKAADKLMEVSSPQIQIIGEPIYDWSKNDFHISVDLNTDKAINMLPDQAITGTTPEGEITSALVPCDSIGNTVLGYGGYESETGATKIYGNQVDIIAADGVSINGITLGGKILYQGASHVNETQTINLSEPVSNQINGIVLVFSLYRNNAAEDVSINTFFISKKEVELLPAAPHFFFLGVNAGFSIMGAKYLYIDDTRITGHSGNTESGTNSGITFNNSNYVLRYVLGV